MKFILYYFYVFSLFLNQTHPQKIKANKNVSVINTYVKFHIISSTLSKLYACLDQTSIKKSRLTILLVLCEPILQEILLI